MNTKAFREATIGKARAINEKAIAENRDLTAVEQAQFDALLGAYRDGGGGDAPNDRHAFAAWVSAPQNPFVADELSAAAIHGAGRGEGVRLYDEQGRCFRGLAKNESFAAAIRESSHFGVTKDEEKLMADGLSFGNMVRASLIGPQSQLETAALKGGSGTAGGFTVPAMLSAQLIDRFRARTCMFELGALTIPLMSDTHSFARITGDAAAAWRRESGVINESEPTFGELTFRPKSLAVIVKVSRELLHDSLNIGQAIERTLVASFAVELDRAGMFGIGVNEPVGLINEEGINELAAVGTPVSFAKLLDAYKLLMDDNAPEPTGVIMSNREWRTFAGLEDTTDQPLQRPKAIEELPFRSTSAVPTNLGAGAESAMLMGYFPDFVFGIRHDLQIEMLRELYAATGEYAFAAHLRVDTGVFHPESFCKLTGVTTGG